MDMSNRNIHLRMQNIFVDYHSILSRNGVSWLVTENEKQAISHVLSAIHPAILKDSIKLDMELSEHELKKDFKGFVKHSMELSQTFVRLDGGPRNTRKKHDPIFKSRGAGN